MEGRKGAKGTLTLLLKLIEQKDILSKYVLTTYLHIKNDYIEQIRIITIATTTTTTRRQTNRKKGNIHKKRAPFSLLFSSLDFNFFVLLIVVVIVIVVILFLNKHLFCYVF